MQVQLSQLVGLHCVVADAAQLLLTLHADELLVGGFVAVVT
jgi:hypothetical protein